MTVSDFWHGAFIAALARLPAEEAKAEADKATALAVAHWQTMMQQHGIVVPVWRPYADVNIADIRKKFSVENQEGDGVASSS